MKKKVVSIVPVNDYVAIEVSKDRTFAQGELVLPETNKELPTQGKVVDLSEKAYMNLDQQVVIGDTIYFRRYVSTEFTVDDSTTFYLIKSEDVIAVVHFEGDEEDEEEITSVELEIPNLEVAVGQIIRDANGIQ